MSWNPIVHTLLCPITIPADPKVTGSEPVTIREIEFKPFTYGAYKEALRNIPEDDEDARFEALAALATGLSVEAIDCLKRPDYVSLSQHVHLYVTKTSTHYQSAPVDPDLPVLLIPLSAGGVARESLALQMPAIKAVKMMKKMATADQRAEWITAHCAELMADDVRALSVPDWNLLQERIGDFLNRPASFFQSVTPT